VTSFRIQRIWLGLWIVQGIPQGRRHRFNGGCDVAGRTSILRPEKSLVR
jgi:hypothetical protein